MSEYVKSQTQFKNKDCLVKALEWFFGTGKVEVYDEPMNLFGYKGDVRPEKANIIVRADAIKEAARAYGASIAPNDLGFRLEGETFVMEMDKYSRTWVFGSDGVWPNFEGRLKQRYAINVVEAWAESEGYDTKITHRCDGKVVVVADRYC